MVYLHVSSMNKQQHIYTIEFLYKIAISLPNILYCYLINSDVYKSLSDRTAWLVTRHIPMELKSSHKLTIDTLNLTGPEETAEIQSIYGGCERTL